MLSDSSYWLVAGPLYTYRKTASPEGWWSSPRSGKTTKYEYGLVLQIPDRPKNTCGEVLWALLDSGNIVLNRLPVRWSFPWVWCGCDRRTPVPSELCSIQWKDLHKQQSYNTVMWPVYFVHHAQNERSVPIYLAQTKEGHEQAAWELNKCI